MRQFARELLRRRVPAVGGLYAGGALAALGAIDDLSEGLGWPPAVFDKALLVLSIGILNALVAGWYHGAKDDQAWTRREVILHAAALVAMIAVALPFPGRHDHPANNIDPDRISVPGFVAGAAEAELSRTITAEVGRLVRSDEPHGSGNHPGWIVSGSVRKVGQELRIAVQLSRMPEAVQVWADRVLVPAESTRSVMQTLLPAIADSILENIKRGNRDE